MASSSVEIKISKSAPLTLFRMGYFGSANVKLFWSIRPPPPNISGLANDNWIKIGTLIHQPMMNIFK